MAQDIKLDSNEWHDLTALFGLLAGDSFMVQNTGSAVIRLESAALSPDEDDPIESDYGIALLPLQTATAEPEVTDKVWAFVEGSNASKVQRMGGVIIGISAPNDGVTQQELADGLATKENAFNKKSAFNKDFGTATQTVCEGNDERLSIYATEGVYTAVQPNTTYNTTSNSSMQPTAPAVSVPMINGHEYKIRFQYRWAETNNPFTSNRHQAQIKLGGALLDSEQTIDGEDDSNINNNTPVDIEVRHLFTGTTGLIPVELNHKCENNGTVYTRVLRLEVYRTA